MHTQIDPLHCAKSDIQPIAAGYSCRSIQLTSAAVALISVNGSYAS